jgi:exodeoxyribonuclease VII large subunit
LPRALRANAHVHHQRLARAGGRLTLRTLQSQIGHAGERVGQLGARLTRCAKVQTQHRRERFVALQARLVASLRANAQAHRQGIAAERERLRRLAERGHRAVQTLLLARVKQTEQLGQLLDALSYRAVLERGFTLVRGPSGKPLHSAADVQLGAALTVEFADGSVGATANGAPTSRPRLRLASSRRGKTSPDQGDLF